MTTCVVYESATVIQGQVLNPHSWPSTFVFITRVRNMFSLNFFYCYKLQNMYKMCTYCCYITGWEPACSAKTMFIWRLWLQPITPILAILVIYQVIFMWHCAGWNPSAYAIDRGSEQCNRSWRKVDRFACTGGYRYWLEQVDRGLKYLFIILWVLYATIARVWKNFNAAKVYAALKKIL